MEQFIASSYLFQYGEQPSEAYVTFLWSLIIACFAIGAIISDFMAQYNMDKFGRKGALYIAATLGIIGATLQSMAYCVNLYQFLIVGRLFTGMGASSGVQTQVVLFSEVAPTRIRGSAGASIHVSAVVATILANFLGFPWALGTSTQWFYLQIVSVIILILFCCFAWRFPESPKSLAVNRKQDDLALDSLSYYNGKDSDVHSLLATIYAEAKEDDFATHKWRLLNLVDFLKKNKNFRKHAVVTICIGLSIPFCGYFLVLTFAVYILIKAGLSTETAHYASLCYCFINLIAAVTGMKVIENHGRRIMTIGGCWTTLICLTVLFICQAIREADLAASTVALTVFSIAALLCHASGKASLTCANDAIRAELFPSYIRATTVIYIGSFWMNLGNLFLSLCYLPIEAMTGCWALLILLILPLFFISLTLLKLCPETKGKHVSSIVEENRDNTDQDNWKLVD